MFSNKQRDLRRLLDLFNTDFDADRMSELASFVDHGEYGLAIEVLSSWIYEDDIKVSPDQEAAILKSSSDYGIDPRSHGFIGRTPPYPDLRTLDQIVESNRAMTPNMENVQRLARSNHMVLAVRMYREITCVGLTEAVDAVGRLVVTNE